MAEARFRIEERYAQQGGHRLPLSMGGGSWQVAECLACGDEATPLHNKPECHRCADWSGCGHNCTHSGWRCENCGGVEGY